MKNCELKTEVMTSWKYLLLLYVYGMLKNETKLSSLTELKACFKMAQKLAFRIFSIIINIVQQYSSIQIRRLIESTYKHVCFTVNVYPQDMYYTLYILQYQFCQVNRKKI